MKLLLIALLCIMALSFTMLITKHVPKKGTHTTLTEIQSKQIRLLKGQLSACNYLSNNKI